MNDIPKFEKRHFEYIASMLHRCKSFGKSAFIDYCADELSKTNPNFKRVKFIDKCLKG